MTRGMPSWTRREAKHHCCVLLRTLSAPPCSRMLRAARPRRFGGETSGDLSDLGVRVEEPNIVGAPVLGLQYKYDRPSRFLLLHCTSIVHYN